MIVETVLEKGVSDGEHELLTESLSHIDKKWSVLHVCVKDYREALAKRNTFAKLYDEVEYWMQQKNQLLTRLFVTKAEVRDLKEIEFVLTQVNQNIDEVQHYSEGKVKHLTQLAVEINGNI